MYRSKKMSRSKKRQETERYHNEQQQAPRCMPGVVSDELGAALGIGRNDIPPWVYRMRAKGLAHPPAYQKRAVETNVFPIFRDEESSSEDKDSDIMIIEDDSDSDIMIIEEDDDRRGDAGITKQRGEDKANASEAGAMEAVETTHHPELETAMPGLENFAVGINPYRYRTEEAENSGNYARIKNVLEMLGRRRTG